MASIIKPLRLLILAILAEMSIGSALNQHQAWADSALVFVPPKGSAPRVTRGAASRGSLLCTQTPTDPIRQMVSLVPVGSGPNLTIAERPSFFVYIPQTSAKQAFFSLKDEIGQQSYHTTVTLPAQAGVIRVELPDTVAPLIVGKSYQWGLAVLCSGKLRPDSPAINGWVQRTELDPKLATQLQAASAMERVVLYSSNGIWYDAVTALAQLRQQRPQDQDLASAWKQILDSVGLEAVSSASLISQQLAPLSP